MRNQEEYANKIKHTKTAEDTINLAKSVGGFIEFKYGEPKNETKLRYHVMVRRLINKHGSLENALKWLTSSQKIIRRRTYSVYKAALKFVAKEKAWDVSILDAKTSNDFRKKMKDSSGHIMIKKIKTEDLLLFTSWLIETDKRPSSPNPNTDLRWPIRAIFMLLATIHTGLRPVEWENAELVKRPPDWPGPDGEFAVLCINAKVPDNKIVKRYVPVSDDNVDQVRRHLEMIQEWKSEITPDMMEYKKKWLYYHSQCSKRLHQAYESLEHAGVKNITMYSGRHQFHANLLANGYHLDEIALLMGHTAVSSGADYGRSKGGAFGPEDGFNPFNRPEI